jgi:hypothetical protein
MHMWGGKIQILELKASISLVMFSDVKLYLLLIKHDAIEAFSSIFITLGTK